ncbi:MAG: isoprenylcysteine carboxylmethyltransferase family protein [Eubacterium sp.]|nr:isoprenylcysteine carboxylmethyltransferase family protein [Eubacterium sp.]
MTQENNDAMMSEKEKLLAEIRADYGEEETSGKEKTSGAGGTPSEESYLTDEELEESISPSPVVTKIAEPLPKYGPGFKFVPITIGVTAVACVLGHIKPITYGIPGAAWLRYTYIGFGIILFIIGIKLIVDALTNSALNENLQMGKLITTGIFSKTRNPIYGGVIFICTAALFFSGNAFMYILPILYWIFLTKLMQATEEPLLEERFGADYRDYRTRTYRFVPIPKK